MRSIEFRTVLIAYTVLGAVMGLLIHFIVLSSDKLRWL